MVKVSENTAKQVLVEEFGSGSWELPQIPKGVKLQACAFVSASSLVPRSWRGWFWELVSDNAPFSWGDNNRSMVTANDFAQHCEERLDDAPKCKRFLCKVRRLGDMYIDLES